VQQDVFSLPKRSEICAGAGLLDNLSMRPFLVKALFEAHGGRWEARVPQTVILLETHDSRVVVEALPRALDERPGARQ